MYFVTTQVVLPLFFTYLFSPSFFLIDKFISRRPPTGWSANHLWIILLSILLAIVVLNLNTLDSPNQATYARMLHSKSEIRSNSLEFRTSMTLTCSPAVCSNWRSQLILLAHWHATVPPSFIYIIFICQCRQRRKKITTSHSITIP